MEISYYHDFTVLAYTGSYWLAAERLYISQPSLSKHIKALEKELGAPLFDRTSRKVVLSEFGKQILPFAQSIYHLQSECELEAARFLSKSQQLLRIATIPVLSQYGITDILIQYGLNHPNVKVDTQEIDTIDVREALISHKCDIGIFRDSMTYLEHDAEEERQLVKIPFATDRLVAVLPNDHPLSQEKTLHIEQLREEYFSFIKTDSMPYNLCMRLCNEAGFVPQVLFTSHRIDAILDMVTKGACIALIFEGHMTPPPGKDILSIFTVIPIEPEVSTVIYISYLKNHTLNCAAQNFIDYCMAARNKQNS